jgi:hypothetical protein
MSQMLFKRFFMAVPPFFTSYYIFEKIRGLVIFVQKFEGGWSFLRKSSLEGVASFRIFVKKINVTNAF